MEWNILVSDPEPWVMYRIFIAGLAYIYVQDVWKVMVASYATSSVAYILSFAMPWSPVHHMFTYPAGVMIGMFVSMAVNQEPSKHPVLHLLSVLPWTVAGFYGFGYMFMCPYVVTLLIAKMYRWALFSGSCMLLNSVFHSPLVSLSAPVLTLLVYSLFFDIYHDTSYTPLDLDV